MNCATSKLNDQGFIEIIRPLTDGANMTGRIRLYIMIRDMDPADDAETFRRPCAIGGYEHEILRVTTFSLLAMRSKLGG